MYSVRIDRFAVGGIFDQTYFEIDVVPTDPNVPAWVVHRSYPEFQTLRRVLEAQHAFEAIPALPGGLAASWLFGDKYVEGKAAALAEFLNQVLSRIEPDPQSVALREFLRISRPCTSRIVNAEKVGMPAIESKSTGLHVPEDVISEILSYDDARRVIALSRTSRAWQRAARSPSLWTAITLHSRTYERVQAHFIRFVESLGPDNMLELLDLEVRFSNRVVNNLRLSLPSTVEFPRLKSLRLSSIAPSTNAATSTSGLFQELLEVILSSDVPSLEAVTLITELNPDLISTLVSISTLRPLKHVQLMMFGHTVGVTESAAISLLSLLKLNERTLEIFEIFLGYQDPSQIPSMAVDSFFGERIGHYPQLVDILSVSTLPNLQKLTFPFFPLVPFMSADQYAFPKSLRQLDLRFVLDGLATRRDRMSVLSNSTNRSIITHVFGAVPTGIQSIRIRTIGVDEAMMAVNSSMDMYRIPLQPVAYETRLSGMLEEWRRKFANLKHLAVDGPGTGLSELIRYVTSSGRIADFIRVFPAIQTFKLTNCITEITEPLVEAMLTNLVFLEELSLVGTNEKLTDTLLYKLGAPGPLSSSIRRGSLRRLVIPRTRYVSFIGMEAIRNVMRETNGKVLIAINGENLVSGREYTVPDSGFGQDELHFSRFY